MAEFQVAIDGPAGSGKSTISKLIAEKLNITHIDTGAMYRAVTFEALRLGVNLEQEESYRFLETTKISYHDNDIYINQRNVTDEIRSKGVTDNVSLVSSFPYVRRKMVEIQKIAASQGHVIMDGRDIGTVVIPHASLKIFLTAHVEERAKRRLLEKEKKGQKENFDNLVKEISLRDKKDSSRVESPLKKADDAIEIDTTNLTIEQVVEKIIGLIKAKGVLK